MTTSHTSPIRAQVDNCLRLPDLNMPFDAQSLSALGKTNQITGEPVIYDNITHSYDATLQLLQHMSLLSRTNQSYVPFQIYCLCE